MILRKKCSSLAAGDAYGWHSDSFSFTNRHLDNPRPGRYWTQIIYLTEGKPLELGDWNSLGVFRTLILIIQTPIIIIATESTQVLEKQLLFLVLWLIEYNPPLITTDGLLLTLFQ